MKRTLTRLGLVLGFVSLVTGALAADPVMDPQLKEKAKRATDYGIRYLRDHQAPDGSWDNSVGITALALRAMLESHRKYTEDDGAFITRPIQYILAHANRDGSVVESLQNRNYSTAVALNALQATKNPAYAEVVKRGQDYLKKLQTDEGEGYAKDHKYYGGIGYGGDERPDLSNQYLAMEALHAAGIDPKDPVFQKAQIFINRCQNWSETNDQKWAANDGGFTYMPGWSPHGGTGSYGGMTSAGLLSLLFSGADKKDPRVQAAYNWIRTNYTLDLNPGVKEKHGLFYYYNAFAKAMYAYGEPTVTDGKGVKHNWRNELAEKLLSLQAKDGSWVNESSNKWWEDNKELVTAWSVIALNLCVRD